MKSLASAEVLSETRARLLRVATDDQPLWGRMTVWQMMRHLGCSSELALGERPMEPVKGVPSALIKFVALRTALPWPKNSKTMPELIQALDECPETGFEELVGVAVAKMEDVARATRLAPKHPIFGSMTTADWMRLGYLHADHHLRQFGR
ncbi:uncharacterized protein DUF1569 [Edaphobacter aggregans]|uniref:Uncharacterized protein DUF1569 n=1 Tax=Edaphobacter aggregans TaxID=570835 RepID=A0A3R9QGC7_9BACT|nr:DUF1569 domain-containing protein [Edaphobacter aggregans]RSL15880.1 uncharacterized protein DUF1569 [Edaphobacter aggregans]